MRIEFVDFVAGARAARGAAVVIDVFRACSLAAHALARGAQRVVPVAGIEEAIALKRLHGDWLLLGERHAKPLPGFDGGNSPAHLAHHALAGRTVIHTTHAGTQGLAAARDAQRVFTGAFVNAHATAAVLRALAPAQVTLVRMGHEGRERSLEDDLCAELLAQLILEREFDVAGLRERLRMAPAARKFFDPAADWAPEEDFDLCVDLDCIDFAVELRAQADGLLALERCFG
jgi:2-phosphosulfolactate phosphatase